MKELKYKKFSWDTHEKNWKLKKPNVCQFELTFKCALRCRHCYTDCYNKRQFYKNELTTGQAKDILDKAYDAGVIWLCFTGGDPLMRKDFLEIYDYAKKKGFIVTVFTSGFSMNKKIAQHLKKSPPFVVEMTLNGATMETFEAVTQVKGSFEKVLIGIHLMLKNKIPLKIKTQLTSVNFHEADKIRKLVRSFGLKFSPSSDIFARLNGDCAPCDLRVPIKELLRLDDKRELLNSDCKPSQDSKQVPKNGYLFNCAAGGGDGLNIDPYGNTFICNLIRTPSINLFKKSIFEARKELIPKIREMRFTKHSICNGCKIRSICHSCPGRAYVETKDMQAPIDYYCRLAHALSKG
jgi:radical SAM protein with 4Fe4S-binding SPASM domain